MNKTIEKLKIAKANYKTSYKKVAKKIGVSQNTVTNWVKGRHQIKPSHEEKLKKYLKSVKV